MAPAEPPTAKYLGGFYSPIKEYATDRLRNVALLGHGASGKTTFTEALLFAAGNTTRMGKVEDGTTLSDYDAEEKRRKQSLNLSVIPVEWKDYKINLLDTPGFPDFAGEMKSTTRVADLGLIFVDAVASIEVGTELAMQTLDEVKIPRAVMISRMDRENANFTKVMGDLHEAFHSDIVPLMLPVKASCAQALPQTKPKNAARTALHSDRLQRFISLPP